MQQLLDYFVASIKREDGETVAEMLSFNRECPPKLSTEILAVRDFSARVGNRVWADCIAAHLKVYQGMLRYRVNGEDDEMLVQIASDQILLAQIFHQQFSNQQNWCLPVLYIINKEVKQICQQADAYLIRTSQKAIKVEEGVRSIYKAFTYCVTDRSPNLQTSRKWGTYAISNLLFQSYFFLSATNLCANIFRALQASDLPPLDEYPTSHRVTFRFFRGVLLFMDEKYAESRDDLEYAFKHCPADSENKRTILKYLIPLKALQGVYPSALLYTKYGVPSEYSEFVCAIQSGNMYAYETLLVTHQDLWINLGIYVLLHKLTWVCFRNLCKRVWMLLDQKNQVDIKYITRSVVVNGGVTSYGMLCNLIDKGMLKGYLSHEKGVAVLSKADPFPRLSLLNIN